MHRGLFVTGTGTDVGKTYVAALLAKRMRGAGRDCGYYKAAASGGDGDAHHVRGASGQEAVISYLYQTPVSPHLAARLEGNPLELPRVRDDYRALCARHDFSIVEGSGGIVCPLRWDAERILLEDVVKMLGLPALVVSDAGLGAINAAALTVFYLREKGIPIRGIVLNRFDGSVLHRDNAGMIEALTGVPIVAAVRQGAASLEISERALLALWEVDA